jgi:DNA-binding MarR family transcriptional regulator
MPKASPPPPIGQLIAQSMRHFQSELFRRLREAGLQDVRLAHLQVSAYISSDGSRLSELAAAARMTLPAMKELVDDLEDLGYVAREPDPTDRRAKLIVLSEQGWEAMRLAGRIIRSLEAELADVVGTRRYGEFKTTFASVLDHLTEVASARAER